MEKRGALYSKGRSGDVLGGRSGSLLKFFLWGLFWLFFSPCRMLIEVFIRRDFGERYFRLSKAVSTFTLLMLLPMLGPVTYLFNPAAGLITTEQTNFFAYLTWHIYLALFLVASIQHHKAIKLLPSVFDFARYSLDSGRSNDTVLRLWEDEAIGGRIRTIFRRITGREVDTRIFECWIEPAPFFLAGILLALVGQNLGWLLMFSAVTYSISYCFSYYVGDEMVMNTIDQIIISEDFAETFLHDADESKTRGYRFLGRKPNDSEMRRAVMERMTSNEEDAPLAK